MLEIFPNFIDPEKLNIAKLASSADGGHANSHSHRQRTEAEVKKVQEANNYDVLLYRSVYL